MKASDILRYVEKQVGMASDEFPDGGFYFGSPEDPVQGILVTWAASMEALNAAAHRGLNLVVCHEDPFFTENEQGPLFRWTRSPDERPYEREDHPNRRRKSILEQSHLTLLQIHYGLDRLCIYEDFAQAIGLGGCIAGDGYEKVYQLPNPMRVQDLAEVVAQRLDLPSIRIAGNLKKVVRRTGNLWGGVGLSGNRYWMRKQIELGAQVLVCGESNEDAIFFAAEYDVPLIITSHVLSENIGLRNFTHQLKKSFPDVPIDIHEIKVPFVDVVIHKPPSNS